MLSLFTLTVVVCPFDELSVVTCSSRYCHLKVTSHACILKSTNFLSLKQTVANIPAVTCIE